MKRLSRYLPLLLVIPVLLLGCAAGDIRWNESNPAGFWAGLWHGMISVVTLIISLFSKNVKMYECFNNGGWYDFGFCWVSLSYGAEAAEQPSVEAKAANLETAAKVLLGINPLR